MIAVDLFEDSHSDEIRTNHDTPTHVVVDARGQVLECFDCPTEAKRFMRTRSQAVATVRIADLEVMSFRAGCDRVPVAIQRARMAARLWAIRDAHRRRIDPTAPRVITTRVALRPIVEAPYVDEVSPSAWDPDSGPVAAPSDAVRAEPALPDSEPPPAPEPPVVGPAPARPPPPPQGMIVRPMVLRDDNVRHAILGVACTLPTTFTKEDLAIACWRSDPQRFGLRGYEDQFPDSNGVWSKLAGLQGLTGRGWVSGTSAALSVTDAGRAAAGIGVLSDPPDDKDAPDNLNPFTFKRSGDVIPIRPGVVIDRNVTESLGGLPQSGRLGDGRECFGHVIVVDVKSRKVSCSTCSKLLDPYEALGILCRQPDRWKWLVDDIKKLHNEIEELTRRRDNLRAAVRRARKRVDDGPVSE